MSAAGTHMRVVPEFFSTSTRAVTSNVRQRPDVVPSASSRPVLGNARPTDAIPAEHRKSRRFMILSFSTRTTFLGFWSIHKITPIRSRDNISARLLLAPQLGLFFECNRSAPRQRQRALSSLFDRLGSVVHSIA